MRYCKKHFWLILVAFVSINVNAQKTLQVQLNDSLKLEADEFRGDIQWQFSMNNQTWEDIENSIQSPFTTVLKILPSFYRAKIVEQNCDPHYSEVIEVVDDGTLLWSEPSTWGGTKPVEGEEVTIPEGVTILLDETPPELGGLTIKGKLRFARNDLTIFSDWILVDGGILEVGTEEQPFEQKAGIVLTGNNPEVDILGMGTRGIMVINGGALELHGTAPSPAWTRLNAHAEAGSSTITLEEDVDWKEGDQIVVAPTDYYQAGNGISVAQRLTLTSESGNVLTTTEGLNAFRWGLLQYATNAGMSLESANQVTPPVADTETTTTPLVLDERAEVGNLTRNIVIQAPNDELWINQGFGVHTMIMPGSIAHVEGVEFKRSGQRGRIRRYPFHWHMLSYSGTETLEDATGQYFKNNSINQSANRGIVIHGTNGVLVQNNIVFDVRGHGIFTEDAVERRNTIDGNLVLHVRNPPIGTALKLHETGDKGSSGFWISNPDNIITNNVAADSQTFGYWLAFPEQPWGENTSVLHDDGLLLRPNRLEFGTFDNNRAHSNRKDGIMLDEVEIDNSGETRPIQYISTTDGREIAWPYTTLKRFALARYKTWKNGDNGIWDRAVWADNFEVVSADNCGRFFAGSGANGIIERSLVVGTSLNHLMNGTGRPPEADFFGSITTSIPVAFATYHSTFDIKNNIVINFPIENNVRSGMFASEDYYLRPVDKGQVRNQNNLIVNSHPGVKLPAQFNHFTLTSALWDPYGIWGPAENYFVYNDPFLTHGKQVTIVEPGSGAGGVCVPGPFYGFRSFVLHGRGDVAPQNQPWFDLMGIHVRRLDNDLNEIASWSVSTALSNYTLQHMRDFATTPDGIYELTFPDEAIHPTNFEMEVENMLTPDDTQVMGIQFDGTLTPFVMMQKEGTNFYEVYDIQSNLDEVINSTGATYWQDKPNNRIWIKMKGGVWQTNDETAETNDALLYEPTLLIIRQEN